MATKFSQFTAVGPSGTTEIVGLDGGSNAKFAVNTLDVSNLAGLPLSIANGGTGQITQKLALDALTDSANQVANDILYIDAQGVAAFKNPSQLPGVPVRTILYATWQPGNNSDNYRAGAGQGSLIKNGFTINVPFNTAVTNFSTDSVGGAISFNYNGQTFSAQNTTFNVPKIGLYKITVNMNLFDQNEGMQITVTAKNNTTNVTTGLIYDVGVFQTGSVGGGQNLRVLSGTNCVSASANDEFEIQILVSGGTNNPDPFPSTNGNQVCSLLVEYIN